jgi:hypothetical protein
MHVALSHRDPTNLWGNLCLGSGQRRQSEAVSMRLFHGVVLGNPAHLVAASISGPSELDDGCC